jgi:hypothetical protein
MLMLASAAEEPTVAALLSRNLGDPAHLQRIHENRAPLAGLPALVPLLTVESWRRGIPADVAASPV